MQLLFVTSEAYPLIKTGGLADVSGALPIAIQALAKKNQVKLLIPGYSAVLTKLQALTEIGQLNILGQACTLLMGKMPNENGGRAVDVITIKNASLYERKGGPYSDENGVDWPDNALRFAVLCKVASLLASTKSMLKGWQPDIVHCNDWQTGLTPAYMKLVERTQVKSLFSIHNMAFQGNFPANYWVNLALPPEHLTVNGYEFFGQISFLKAGIFYADQISTVSPTYAKEIQTAQYGFGLHGLLKARQANLTGILNGIDTQDWNPATDAYLPAQYNIDNLTGKSITKQALQQSLGLNIDANAPLLGVVSRLTHQKGLDLLPTLIPTLLAENCQLAVLGSGDKPLENSFKRLATQYPNTVSVNIGYHEALSHNIMAGSDIFIMPSRFEPCGLNQMYGLAYGTPPIVSPTGGLADSVTNTDAGSLQQLRANGFVLENVTTASLLVTIKRALSYFKNKNEWRQIQSNGMREDLSWASRAKLYVALYENILGS